MHVPFLTRLLCWICSFSLLLRVAHSSFLPTACSEPQQRHRERSILTSVCSTWSSSSSFTRLYYGSSNLDTARQYVRAGMQSFRQGRIAESITYFDQAQAAEPRLDPYLWQRGLSYYYANQFSQASQQFRRDVQVNPLDVEEIVWDIASQLRLHPEIFPVPNALTLPPNQTDRRPIMNVVYQLFQGQGTEQALARAGHDAPGRRASDEFYALLYLGLFAEVRQEPTKAQHYFQQALQTEYATTTTGRSDYMTDVARVRTYVCVCVCATKTKGGRRW